MLLASVPQGWICSDKFMCHHTETEAAIKLCEFDPTQSQYTDMGPSSTSVDPVIITGTWQGLEQTSRKAGKVRLGKVISQTYMYFRDCCYVTQ